MPESADTAIANIALTKLGAARLLDITDDVKAARAVRALWDITRDSELRSHNWRFSIKRALLPALASPPPWGFDYAYQLPNESLRVIQVDEFTPGADLSDYRESLTAPYQLEADPNQVGTNIIVTDIGPPLKVRYVARIEPPGYWDGSFKSVFVCRLAMDLCEELTQSNTKRQLAQTEYMAAIREAVRTNAIERPNEPLQDDTWILSRLS